jgi:hypothetical protein
MTQPTPRALGWKPGPPDPRTLRLASYTTADLQPPPPSLNWMASVQEWPLLGNDRIGDCVLVSCAHLVQAWTAYARTAEVRIPEADVIAAYSRVTGYDPRTGRGDNGTNTLDALNFWRKTGIGGRRISAYVQLDHTDHTEVRTAAHLFGGIYIAAELPVSASTQFDQGRRWAVQPGGRGRRGSWGGHAMHLGAYGPIGYSVSTWGRTQSLTVGWWNAYVSEAFAVISEDWLTGVGGRNPLGFDLTAMLADLRRITA